MSEQAALNRYYAPGTKVRLNSLNRLQGEMEVGVVVHCWYEEEIYGHDCYVAFFGNTFPEKKPSEKPYVLRYASAVLRPVEE